MSKRSPKTRQGFRRRGSKGTDGKYSYELYVMIGYKDELNTKPDRKYKTVRCNNNAEAIQELNKFALAIHSDNYIKPEAKTLQKFFEEWITTYAKESLAHNTLTTYRNLWKMHIAPKLGHVALKDFKTIRLKDFMNQLRNDLSPATKNKIFNTLSTVFTKAVEWELLMKNPMLGVTRPKIPKKKITIYENDQLQIFLHNLQDAPTQWRMFYLFLLETGARSSEAVGMTWDKVNYVKNEIEISRSVFHDGETKLKETKNEKERLIAINTEFAQALRSWEIELGKMGNKAGEIWQESRRFLFPNLKTGKPLHPASPRTWLDKFIKKNNLGKINPHGFRHLHASYLLMKNVPHKIVSERLGHSSTRITTDIYGHVTREADRQAASQMRNIYSIEKVLKK